MNHHGTDRSGHERPRSFAKSRIDGAGVRRRPDRWETVLQDPRRGRVVAHLLKTPAPDQFSSPGTLEVQAGASLGDVGDDVRVKVRISGYGRSYGITDPETGERVQRQTAEMRLTVVE